MNDKSYLDWPFFDAGHRWLAAEVNAWAAGAIGETGFRDHRNVDKECAALLRSLAEAGFGRFAVPGAYGGRHESLDVRSLCLIRETLARYSGLADFVFAMQGLGGGVLSLFGTPEQCHAYLPAVAEGRKVAAFALTEPEAGSDVAALQTKAVRDGHDFLLTGTKTFISNGGIADFYVVFARTEAQPGPKGISAFVVDADTPSLEASERIRTIAPHPLATLHFDGCRVPAANMIGAPGGGFKIAMATLDTFRPTVGAAALGFARRALTETARHTKNRELFGAPLSDMQMTQDKLADMALEIDASALLIYRAAWCKDRGQERVSREASMAKLYATEAAQSVIDKAVQLFGGRGVTSGNIAEALYREIRALRIYEGSSEVHKLIIARHTLEATAGWEG